MDDLLDRYVQEHERELKWLKQYVLRTESEDVMPAAQRISEVLSIGLDEVTAAIQKLGSRISAAPLSGEGTLTGGGSWVPAVAPSDEGTLTGGAQVPVTLAGAGAGTESIEVVRTIDVNELSELASLGGLARLSANQRLLVAVILITAIFPALPPEVQRVILDDAGWAAAVATVLGLLKR